MSKLSFRARAVDVHKPMPVHIGDGVPTDYDAASVSRAVLEMPTGMEKDEETEHHLQRALNAQQAYGTAEALAIPVPEMDSVGDRFLKLYGQRSGFKVTKQYIHVQPALGLDAEVPDYDMDSEDEQWLNRQVKTLKMEVSALKFENMIDRLEKGSGQTVVTLNEAKALLKEDDELTMAVYDYWLNKRLKTQLSSLIPQVKTERRDGSASNNPYVAFRRRTEKMQTRKNRKNDEASYEKMLKLRKDLQKSLNILEMLKRREKAKKEQGKLTVEILEKRSQMQDWDGAMLAEAEAKKGSMPKFHPMPPIPPISIKEWSSSSIQHNDQPKSAQKKREYRKEKRHKHAYLSPPVSTPSSSSRRAAHLSPSIGSPPQSHHLPYQTHHFFGPPTYRTSGQNYEDDLNLSSPSQSDQEKDVDHPDGVYAFKRRPGCSYLAPREFEPPPKRMKPSTAEEGRDSAVVRDPMSDLLFGSGSSIHAFHLVSLPRKPEGSRCLGYVRQRVGRGGRVMLDRRISEWDEGLNRLDMYSVDNQDPLSTEYAAYIRSNNIVHYRQSSQSMFGQPQHIESSSSVQGNAPSSLSTKSSLLKPIIMCNFDKQVQMLVHLRHSDRRNSESRDSDSKTGFNDNSAQGLPHSPSVLQPIKCLNTVGDQKANLVISSIRGLTNRRKDKNNVDENAKTCVASVVKNNLANGRVGLSTMPAASILQLNFPLTNTRPNSKTFSSTGNNNPPSTSVNPVLQSSSSSSSSMTPSNSRTTLANISIMPQDVTITPVVNTAGTTKSITTTPVKSVINNGLAMSTPTRIPNDNGLVSKRFLDNRLTVHSLLLSSPNNNSLIKQQQQTTLSQQKHANSIKFLHPSSLIASENSPSISLISPSSSAPFLSQKLQQKSQGAIKGGHQVLVRASVGAAYGSEKPNRDTESTQSSEDKNKTFAMEVT